MNCTDSDDADITWSPLVFQGCPEFICSHLLWRAGKVVGHCWEARATVSVLRITSIAYVCLNACLRCTCQVLRSNKNTCTPTILCRLCVFPLSWCIGQSLFQYISLYIHYFPPEREWRYQVPVAITNTRHSTSPPPNSILRIAPSFFLRSADTLLPSSSRSSRLPSPI